MEDGIWTLITSVGSFIGASGIISGLILRRIDRLEKKLDAREADLVEENIVRGDAIITAGKLSEANTLALRCVTTDEACEAELAAHRAAADRLEHFMRSKSAQFLHSN